MRKKKYFFGKRRKQPQYPGSILRTNPVLYHALCLLELLKDRRSRFPKKAKIHFYPLAVEGIAELSPSGQPMTLEIDFSKIRSETNKSHEIEIKWEERPGVLRFLEDWKEQLINDNIQKDQV